MKNNKNNKGRVKELQQFYNSKTWKQVRQNYLQQVNYICERCSSAGVVTPAKIVHHITYLNLNNYQDINVSLSFNNLEALCANCHNKEHFKNIKSFDIFGNLKEF